MRHVQASRFLALFAIFAFIVPASALPVLRAEIKETTVQVMDAKRWLLGYASKKDATGKQTITKVHLGSAANYDGLREGDAIVSETIRETPRGLAAQVSYQRDGKTYSLEIEAPGDYHQYLNGNIAATAPPKPAPAAERKTEAVLAARPPEPAPVAEEVPPPAVTLEAKTEKVFRGRDLVVLIDRSGSMDATDCPGATSRWDWCKQQVVSLSNATRNVFPTGFTLGIFNNHCDLTDNADVDAIASAFTTHKPEGGTYTGDAILHQIRDYRERKKHGGAKPLVIIVVTDGAPNSPSGLRDVLVGATADMEKSDELQVVFIQIGQDDQSTTLLEQLERHLTDNGARFPIAHAVTFEKVEEAGLLKAITDALGN